MILDIKFDSDTTIIPAQFAETEHTINAYLGEIYQVTAYIGGELYQGNYEVTPSVESQTLATKERVLTDDITILEIPFFSVGNTSGGNTVYIGTEKEMTII